VAGCQRVVLQIALRVASASTAAAQDVTARATVVGTPSAPRCGSGDLLAVAFDVRPALRHDHLGQFGAPRSHDATLPFLMLAPVTRFELLAGKLAGALVIPFAFHLAFVGISALVFGSLEILAPYSASLGGSPAWWVAFLLGAPASGAFVGAQGTVISSLSSDVRTSMQYTSFFIGLLSLGIGYALVDAVSEGVALQVGYAVGCLVFAGLTLRVGANIISRDVTP